MLTLNRITQFLEIEPFESELLARQFSIGGVRSTIRDMNSDSLGRLTDKQREKVYGIAKDILHSYGYSD